MANFQVRSASALMSILFPIVLIIITHHAPSCTARYIMFSGDTLKAGQGLTMNEYTLYMGKDCNLVLYEDGSSVWSSGTSGKGSNCYTKLERNGYLSIYNEGILFPIAVWKSNDGKYFPGEYILVLQPDRNVVIYGEKIWNSGTGSSSLFANKKLTSNKRIDMVTNEKQWSYPSSCF